jgi:hypothetical protein
MLDRNGAMNTAVSCARTTAQHSYSFPSTLSGDAGSHLTSNERLHTLGRDRPKALIIDSGSLGGQMVMS